MKKPRLSDSPVLATLKQAKSGMSVPELYREYGMSSASSSRRAKYGCMGASLMARLKEPGDENRRLKKIYAEERLKSELRKEALEKSGEAFPVAHAGEGGGQRTWRQYSAGLRGLLHQRDLPPVPAAA